MTSARPIRYQVVDVSDSRRQGGALIDIFVSVATAVITVVAIVAYRDLVGRVLSFPEALAILMLGWAADILIYAIPVAMCGGSIGNLVTGRRVVDADTRTPLSTRRAVRRYFARRNAWRWQRGGGKACLVRPDGDGLRASYADRVVGSAVTRRS